MIPLPPPDRSFASDNTAGAHPEVLAAMVAANDGHVLAYGDDPWTTRAEAAFGDLFGAPVQTLFVWGGTGANMVALQSVLQPFHSVVCTSWSHLNVDETGAPERVLGTKLVAYPSEDGKVRVEHLDDAAAVLGEVHHSQPGVVSITQSTELGTLYTPDEIGAIAERAHALGMLVHMDGARIANATSAIGDLRAHTLDAGVDVISFGGTKNGLVYGEAVVWLRPELARYAGYLRKQLTQLPSKMRFVSAQFLALLEDDLWLRSAGHANAMAARLGRELATLPGVTVPRAVEVNGVFPRLPQEAIAPLRAWTPFYTWDASVGEVRLLCSFDTTDEDVDRLVAGVRHVLEG
ncbi:MAG: low specificity L-threonine aldolase [Acidimicrobiales bacterium]|jgi:threonine aldolase|nr:low specificity L-threonine aldolase [Acidimicrobiales bacterium]